MNNNISSELVRSVKNEYFRKWRKENRDKVKRTQEKYWQKKAEQILNEKQEGAVK